MKKALLSLILLLVLFPLNAQLETAHWYFGNRVGIDFTSGSPVLDFTGKLETSEGCSSISDRSGNLLFYTDGITVYDRTHKAMPNGKDLKGDHSSSQSGVIIPNAYNKSQYYIFTVDANDSDPSLIRGLHYTVVDMTLNIGNGDVVVKKKNVPLALNGVHKSSEKITAVKHSNGKDIWVITHFLDSFYAFLINGDGVSSTPVISKIGINIPFQIKDKIVYPNNGRGYIKASPNGKKIAIAHLSAIQEKDYADLPTTDFVPNCDVIYSHGGALRLYDFNNTTGVVSNEVRLDWGGKKSFYGIEFSPDSKLLYAEYNSFKGELKTCRTDYKNTLSSDWEEGKLIQFNLEAFNILFSRFTIYQFYDRRFNSARGALQMALDKKIYYVPGTSSSSISVINNPNVYGASANFTPYALSWPKSETYASHYGLPPFIVSFFNGDILVNGALNINEVCLGSTDKIAFSLDTNITSAYTIDWDFGDGKMSTNLSPSHYYLDPGVYTVTATVSYGSEKEVFTKEVTISPIPVVDLGVDITTCDATPIILDAGNAGGTYLWSTGETTQTIAVSASGTYSVAVTNVAGCTGSDKIEVTFNANMLVDLGADITTCDATPIVLDAGNAGSTYLWSTGETTQTIIVTASGTYSVAITNASGCTDSDEVKVTFNPSLIVDLGADITTCDATPIILNAGNIGSTYLWSTGETTQTITVTTSGTYSVAVTDASGCTGSDEVAVTFNPSLIVDLGADITTCDATPIVLNAGNIGSTYLWSTGETTQTITVTTSGTYSVAVTDASGCTGSDEVAVTFNPSLIVDLGADITTCDATPIVLNAGNIGSTYLWSTGETTQTITVSTSGTYSVAVTDASGCIGSDEVAVTFNANILVDLGADITTCDATPIILDAGNIGSTYLWSTGETTQTITVTTSGTYSVSVTNASGCIGSDEVEVTFNTNMLVDLGADITTCDATPIVLDAGNAGSTYLWSTGETTQTIAVSASGTYSVSVTNASGCIGSDEVEVTFNTNMLVDLGADITTCDATPIILDAGNIGSTYLWNTGETTQTIAVSASGTYSVAVANAAGCKGSDEVAVTFNPALIVDLGADITTCEAAVILDAGHSPTDATIVWTLPDGTTQSGTQTIEAKQSGKYTVSITKDGCTITDEIKVTLSAKPYIIEVKTNGNSVELIAKGNRPLEYSLDAIHWQASPYFTDLAYGIHSAYVRDAYGCTSDAFDFGLLNIPNIITPNGDGKNDAWNLKGLELYPGSKIQIFDRYGKPLVNKVFTENPAWDGKYLNKPAPSTTYWYIIELTDGRKLNGSITVKNY